MYISHWVFVDPSEKKDYLFSKHNIYINSHKTLQITHTKKRKQINQKYSLSSLSININTYIFIYIYIWYFLCPPSLFIHIRLMNTVQTPNRKYKTSLCKHFEQRKHCHWFLYLTSSSLLSSTDGFCTLAERCSFAHGEDELRKFDDVNLLHTP